MNWQAIGAIGEVAGAIGVILTLAYLARQMRINTIALKNETTRDSVQMVIDSYSTVISDEEVASIYLRGMQDFHALSEVEQIRFHYVCTQRLHAASTSRAFNDVTNRKARVDMTDNLSPWIERMLRNPGFRQWWESRGHAIVEPDFAEYVQSVWSDMVESGELSRADGTGTAEPVRLQREA
ncbi:MAG: hypothetical protein PVF57_19995 [Pseudomonadales bacterium]